MHDYRVYVFDGERHLIGPAVAIPASDDDDAIAQAKIFPGAFSAELRDGTRLVKKLPASQAAEMVGLRASRVG